MVKVRFERQMGAISTWGLSDKAKNDHGFKKSKARLAILLKRLVHARGEQEILFVLGRSRNARCLKGCVTAPSGF